MVVSFKYNVTEGTILQDSSLHGSGYEECCLLEWTEMC
jgi:hypothetical protein